jgi:hypothetical protein
MPRDATKRVGLKKVLGIVVWALVIGFGVWLLGLFFDAYRTHIRGFIALWLVLPIIAYYLVRIAVEGNPSAAKSLNVAFVALSVLLSFAGLADYGQVRDSIGEHYVSGYMALRGEVESGDDGRPYTPTDVYTDHWYSKFALWLLEWLFLGACVGLPILTHKAVRRGSKRALPPPTPHIAGRTLEFLQRQQAIRPGAKLEGIFFTREAAWAYLEHGGRAEVIVSTPEEDLCLVFTNLSEAEEIEKASRREENRHN